MNFRLQRQLLMLQTYSALKKVGILQMPAAAKLLAVAQAQSNPEKTLGMLEDALAVTQLFASPFPKPDVSVAGPLALGIAENGQLIGLLPQECHVLIAGQTGAGKTTLLRSVFSQAAVQGHPYWLFVRAEDTRCLVDINPNVLIVRFDEDIRVNPLNPSPLREDEHANVFLDIFIQSQRLYDGTKNYLQEQLSSLYRDFETHHALPSLHDLYEKLKSNKHSAFSRTERYRESALNRLGGILAGSLGRVFDCSRGLEIALPTTSCIFEIGNLTSEQQVFVVNLLVTRLFHHRLSQFTENWMTVGIDDGNLLFDISFEKRPDLGLPIIHHLLTTVRKSKLNVFCCTQTPSQVGTSIHSNSAIKIMFALANGQDIEQIQRSVGNMTDDQKAACYKLAPRQFIVKNSYRYPEALLGTLPEIPEAREISKEETRRNNAFILSRFPRVIPRYVAQQQKPERPRPQAKEKPADDKLKAFLMAVYNQQYKATLTETCRIAGLSAGTGSRVAEECVKQLYVKLIPLPFGKGNPRYPVLLTAGYRLLGAKEKRFYGKGAGYEHILYQHLIAQHFAAYSPVIEANRNGKFIDVVLTVKGRHMAVEVATTAKNERNNVERDFAVAQVDRVLIACESEPVLRQVRIVIEDLPVDTRRKVHPCLLSELLTRDPAQSLQAVLEDSG